jgi:hypothetical protein
MAQRQLPLLEQTNAVVQTVLAYIRESIADPGQAMEYGQIARLYRDSVREGYYIAKRVVETFTFYLNELVSKGLVVNATALVNDAQQSASQIVAWMEVNAQCVRSMEGLIDNLAKLGAKWGSSDLIAKITIKEITVETNILGLLGSFVAAIILRKDQV